MTKTVFNKPNPAWICHACGLKYCNGLREDTKHCATYHIGECDCCGAIDLPVTEPRDYGHIKAEYLQVMAHSRSAQGRLIEATLSEFNFEKVHAIMQLTNWQWLKPGASPGDFSDAALEVPSIDRIKQVAAHVLKRLLRAPEILECSSGGLTARLLGYDPGNDAYDGVSLSLVYEETEAYFEDLE